MLEEQESPTDAFAQQVNKNVIDWFVNHIRGFDRAVAEYKNQKIANRNIKGVVKQNSIHKGNSVFLHKTASNQ